LVGVLKWSHVVRRQPKKKSDQNRSLGYATCRSEDRSETFRCEGRKELQVPKLSYAEPRTAGERIILKQEIVGRKSEILNTLKKA